jgi:hypothetical protein
MNLIFLGTSRSPLRARPRPAGGDAGENNPGLPVSGALLSQGAGTPL